MLTDRGSRRSACLRCSSAASQRPRPRSASAVPVTREASPGATRSPFSYCSRRAVVVQSDYPFIGAQRHVSLRAVWRKRDGFLRRLPGAIGQRGRRGAVGVQKRIGVRDSGPRLRESGIQRYGLLVEAERLAQAGRIAGCQAVRRFLALQEGVVGGEVLRGLLRKPLLLAGRERAAQRLRHLRRDVRLDLEDIRDRRVEGLLPPRCRRSGRA